MKVNGVDMVMVMVSDTARSVAWYQEVLGLGLRMQHGDFAVLETGDVPLALHGGRQEGEASASLGTTVVLRVDDYAASKAELEGKGCRFVFENTQPHAVFGTFLDPDGNPLQILERTSG